MEHIYIQTQNNTNMGRGRVIFKIKGGNIVAKLILVGARITWSCRQTPNLLYNNVAYTEICV